MCPTGQPFKDVLQAVLRFRKLAVASVRGWMGHKERDRGRNTSTEKGFNLPCS